MTDKEKLEKLVAYIKSAAEYYANDVEQFGGKLAALYDIELYMEVELKIPMHYGKENRNDDSSIFSRHRGI